MIDTGGTVNEGVNVVSDDVTDVVIAFSFNHQ